MSYIQMQEEAEYTAAARYDRFDGFDRGDADRDEPYATTVIIARQTLPRGRLTLVRTDFNDYSESIFILRFEGCKPLYFGESEADARAIANKLLRRH